MRRNAISIGLIAIALLAVAAVIFAGRTVRWRIWPVPQTAASAGANTDIYRNIGSDHLNPALMGLPERVYVPDIQSGDVRVIDARNMREIAAFPTGRNPQHVVPSWDLRTLWVTGSAEDRHGQGSLTPIDPYTLTARPVIAVADAYNLYFAPDGSFAIVVAEERRRLEFRDPTSMQLKATLPVPACAGINHADYPATERYIIFTCEFAGALVKIDIANRRVLGFLKISNDSMPQDIRAAPDGRTFYVADMTADGVYMLDGERFDIVGFLATGPGAHGLCISRDGKMLYVSNRGSHSAHGPPHGPGSISVIDFATRRVIRNWAIPGGGSPDMGNISRDGKYLWVSGRFDDVVYRVNTVTGEVSQIPVGREPHGLTVWPQPGRISLGHTGNMR